MKYNIKKYINITCLALAVSSFSACEKFLDRQPLDEVTPEQFFSSENDLAAYAINAYSFPSHGNWDMGLVIYDYHTDNVATTNASEWYWEPGNRRVPSSDNDNYTFSPIRNLNYFLQEVLPKAEAGEISGNADNINHYIGEIYFMRALRYFNMYKLYGDVPIVTTVPKDDREELVALSKRAPRNEVARFILEDLDKAISMLKTEMNNNNRLTRKVATQLRARVALYEARWLTYHQGTAFVPGGPDWPGAQASYNEGFTIDLNAEINYFLTEAMKNSKEIADAIQLTVNSGVINPEFGQFSGFNPYFEMFGALDMGTYPEILFWRQYSSEQGILHSVPAYILGGGNMGYTKGYIDSHLMKNGLPIYASGSGYHGDSTLDKVNEDRDERLQLFVFDNSDNLAVGGEEILKFGDPLIINNLQEQRDVTGYRNRKYYNYTPEYAETGQRAYYGCPIYRAAESYLIYMEASYMKNKSLDSDAIKYWKALRERAGVSTDIQLTIDNTDVSKENDWGAYSAGKMVDATLYNIRRERRIEMIGETTRWDDLKSWRALDQVQNYIIEGVNLWDELYKSEEYISEETKKTLLIEQGKEGDGETPNVSSSDDSKYLRPYRAIKTNNTLFNGYTWTEAAYLSPIPAYEILLTADLPATEGGETNLSTSPLYQNPYWPNEANMPAER